jgi:hypothetical protein
MKRSCGKIHFLGTAQPDVKHLCPAGYKPPAQSRLQRRARKTAVVTDNNLPGSEKAYKGPAYFKGHIFIEFIRDTAPDIICFEAAEPVLLVIIHNLLFL